MKVDRTRTYAVITGDIVASSSLPPADREHLFHVMREGAALLQDFMGDAMPLPLDIFSGDSWQLLLAEPAKALRAALFFRTWLVARMREPKLDTRAVIAVGGIDFVPRQRVSEGEGEAFRASGRTLAEMDRNTFLRFVSPGLPHLAPWDCVARLIDAMLRRELNAARARALNGVLRQLSQKETAAAFPDKPVSQPNVAKLLTKVYWREIAETVLAFEQTRFAPDAS